MLARSVVVKGVESPEQFWTKQHCFSTVLSPTYPRKNKTCWIACTAPTTR